MTATLRLACVVRSHIPRLLFARIWLTSAKPRVAGPGNLRDHLGEVLGEVPEVPEAQVREVLGEVLGKVPEEARVQGVVLVQVQVQVQVLVLVLVLEARLKSRST
jgi:hypothetical protein